MRTRGSFLIMTLAIALVAVACGRASQKDIDSALGITPTATLSAAEIATGTSQAIADATKQAQALAALSSPGSGGSPVSLAAAGDVVQGRTQFMIRCQQCHQPAGTGTGPALTGPNNPAVAMTDEQLEALIRTGVNHSTPPGAFTTIDISDRGDLLVGSCAAPWLFFLRSPRLSV
jgi:mono/diheme cytochrome c family protein